MLSVIIVTYNSADVIGECLRSVYSAGPYSNVEVIVVDNASTDGTVENIAKSFPEIQVIANRENIGFARAVNQGVSMAAGDCVFLLNPDTQVGERCLSILREVMDRYPATAIAAPRIQNVNGSGQPSVWNFPSVGSLLIEMIVPHVVASSMLDRTPKGTDRRVDVESASGAALMIRKSVFDQLGGFDERFFMYYEDIDFCLRCKQAGFTISFVPGALVRHYQGKSSWRDPISFFQRFYSSKIMYARKHFTPGEAGRAVSLIIAGLWWKNLFYSTFGALFFRPHLRKLGESYLEARKLLLLHH